MEVAGEQTELDKTILERMHDPLVHLIRNSIDHGLKSPDERESLGKPRQGAIRLTAAHQGDRVNIVISDDGMGINTALMRKKAVEKGLIKDNEVLSETQIHALLFMPGFSTAQQVTGVSGRGVGMDVVKQEISALGGTIKIENRPGQGVTFQLSMPLTLAITASMSRLATGISYCLCLKWTPA